MVGRLHPLVVRFWRSASGREPVRDWLNALSDDQRRIVGRDIAKVQYGWPLGLPLCRPMGEGLWEIRSSLPHRTEVRILFGFVNEELVLLHAFVKKTAKTPQSELSRARERLKECDDG